MEKSGISKKDAQRFFDAALDTIALTLQKGDKVQLSGFGVFEVKERKGRTGRNPHKPEIAVPIPDRMVVKFRAGKELKKRVLSLKK